MSEEKGFSLEDFSIGLVSGLFAGAVIAVLLAPSSGEKTRQKLQDWATDTRQSTVELVDKAKVAFEKVLQKAETTLGFQEKGIKKKLEQIRTELERFDLSGSKNVSKTQ
ncbi:MAG: YtxH domain-containing protein [Actinobacteria bacterium]|nr:MAG: YtxH domain-containing protein [Actinomycetota bacterium]